MNVYKDLVNDLPIVNLAGLDNIEIDFIPDSAHLANPVLMMDTDLPDAPMLHQALSGPECDSWHAAILEELAAIMPVCGLLWTPHLISGTLSAAICATKEMQGRWAGNLLQSPSGGARLRST